jgi:hypothetical protein
MPATSKPKRYNPRHPERTLLHQTVAEHYETRLELACLGQFDGKGGHHSPSICIAAHDCAGLKWLEVLRPPAVCDGAAAQSGQ